jgi:hypothetical protein
MDEEETGVEIDQHATADYLKRCLAFALLRRSFNREAYLAEVREITKYLEGIDWDQMPDAVRQFCGSELGGFTRH